MKLLNIIVISAFTVLSTNCSPAIAGSPQDATLSISGPSYAVLAQLPGGHRIDMTGKLQSSNVGSGWDIESDGRTYHIQNPGQWINEDWFDSGTQVQVIGYLRSDTAKATIVASQIFHVESSEVRNTGERVRDEIKKQIDKQVSGNKVTDLLKRIPFLDRLFDRFGR